MSDNQNQPEKVGSQKPPKLGIWLTIASHIYRIKSGDMSRKRRRTKGRTPPSTGICGPINHGEDGNPWVWVEVETLRGWQLKTRKRKNQDSFNFDQALRTFVGRELDIQVQAVPYDLEKLEDSFKAGVAGKPSQKVLERHERSRQRNLDYIHQKHFLERRVYIGITLRDERSFLELILAKLLDLLGYDSTMVNGNEDEIYREQINEVVGKFAAKHVKVQPLTGLETARVIQRCVSRGKQTLVVHEDESGVINSYGSLMRLAKCVARDHHDYVEIMQDDGSRYVAYLAVAKLPTEDFIFNWFFVGDMEQNPVEISARLKIEQLEVSKARVTRTIQILTSSLDHLRKQLAKKKNVQLEYQRQESRKKLAEATRDRLNSGVPLVKVNAFYIVSSDSVERLKSNRNWVIQNYSTKGVILEIDQAYQAEIRRQTYPGARQLYTEYQLDLFTDGIAVAMPHASPMIGNGGDLHGVVRGFEISPFCYSHRNVLQRHVDTKTGQVFIGPSGEGKTDAMAERAIADAIANMAVIFDEGKGDTQILASANPEELLVDIKIMDLSSPLMAGVLNPLYMGEDLKESRDLTLSFLMKCMGSGETLQGWKPLLAEVIRQELDEYPADPDFHRIVHQRLLNSNDPPEQIRRTKREIGNAILTLMEARHAEVMFSKGRPWQEVADEYIRCGQVTFVIYGHLTPPDGDKLDKDLSEQERLALLARDLTNVLYYKFAMNPQVPLAIYKDEIQIDNRMGGSVSSAHLSRIGRSKGSTINLGGQIIGDVPEDFWENTSTMNFFRFTTPDAAKQAIKLLRIQVDEGSEEEASWINLLLDVPHNERRKYDVIVRTHSGEIGLVAFKQFYHRGLFASNTEAVEARRQQQIAQNAS